MISNYKYLAVQATFLLILIAHSNLAHGQDTQIDSGLYTVSVIRYEGLERTKRITVEREMQIRADSTYSARDLELARQRSIAQMKNLNLFNHVQIYLEPLSETDSATLLCRVEVIEKWYFWPLPFVEFADRNFNQWYQFRLDPERTNFGLYLFNYNVRGRDQTVKLSLVTGYTQNIGILYNVPFTSWNNNVGYFLQSHYRTNREVWYKTVNNELQFLKDPEKVLIKRQLNSGSLYYRVNRTSTVYFNLGYDRISISDTVLSEEGNRDFLVDGMNRQTQYSAGFSFIREARNNRLFPWKGHFLGIYTSSSVLNDMGTVLHYLGAKGAVYHPFSPRWSVAGSGSFKLTSLRDAPYYNFKSFGYGSNVRGFENYVVEGQHFVLLKSGLRFALFNEYEQYLPIIPFRRYKNVPFSLYLELFADGGYVVNHTGSPTNDLQNKWLYGTGIGVNMSFYFDKVIRFELTRNNLDQYGLFVHFNKSF